MIRILVFFAVGLFCFSNHVRAGDLTPEQIESLRRALKGVKDNLDTHIHSRNSGARSTFLSASKDPRAAVQLYLDCYKKVNYEMEGRSDAEFRAWKEGQTDRLKEDSFVQSLMILLEYLALSCHAAEVEEIDEVFSPLNSYVEKLSNMDELPDNIVTSGVANCIFARAYDLEQLLGSNENWETVPFNIPGIYEKTILPHLRANNPDSLMAAWDKRIDQQKRLVLFFEEKKQEELRGLDRDQKIRRKDRQEQRGGIMRSHDLEDFNRETLPRLQWGKMKDHFRHVDQLGGAKLMLEFVKANLTTKNGEYFYNDFMSTLESAQNGEGEAGAPNL